MKRRCNAILLFILTMTVFLMLIVCIEKEQNRKQTEKLESTEIETEILNDTILVAEASEIVIEPRKAVIVKEYAPEPKEAPEPIVEAVTGSEEPEPISLGEFKLTAYCNCEKCCGKWAKYGLTASGTVPEEGRTIAADWDVLPEGTAVLIDGKEYIVEDSGSGVDGKHIDVFFDSHRTALEFGVQYKEIFRWEE